ncbi:hypothetical protein Q8A67_015572 [Cirrhinus molitorella]|uniref:Uncharacterized protein n=1 Tax=Cirrhinus molitorella TaxID=172907 RepID=A0AA88TIY3_9TELE|nr:hypothetical protein Q8A67_015572 [Cirrhinus molitorella]
MAQETHDLFSFTPKFCRLAVTCPYDDETLKSLFWIGANFHQPVDLPDTTGLSWRDAIIRFLESVWPRSRTKPDPEPSQASPRSAELPEPTAEGEPEPAVVFEPSPSGATERMTTPDPEPEMSDQVTTLLLHSSTDTAHSAKTLAVMDILRRSSYCGPSGTAQSLSQGSREGLKLRPRPIQQRYSSSPRSSQPKPRYWRSTNANSTALPLSRRILLKLYKPSSCLFRQRRAILYRPPQRPPPPSRAPPSWRLPPRYQLPPACEVDEAWAQVSVGVLTVIEEQESLSPNKLYLDLLPLLLREEL